MTDPNARIVIVGAGHAGGTVAVLLRQYGFGGPITLLGEEPIPPYQRPPLSKAWLKGNADEDAIILKSASFYTEQGIDLRLVTRVSAIQLAEKSVVLATGEAINYDILILAMGARPRRLSLPGADLEGVLELRTAADAEILRAALRPGTRLAVIGGGYVGLEVAASGRLLGAEVTVIEVQPRVLARVAAEPLSRFFEAYHRARGVILKLSVGVDAIDGEGGKVRGVRLSDGHTIGSDLVLVGVGAVANDDVARAAGLDCADGVVVDIESRASDPAVFAIGDVTRRPMPLYDRMFRLESVPNALEQAKQATAAITGHPAPGPEVPWFWSDQYDLKMQIAGLPFDADEVLIRGDPASARFAVFHLKDGRVRAVEAVNAAPEFMAGKRLIGQRRPISRERLANPAVSMKEVAV
jgi:3-phenylpropionate/trans-cinnamate dioxygenase ferredoxin reductase subunit